MPLRVGSSAELIGYPQSNLLQMHNPQPLINQRSDTYRQLNVPPSSAEIHSSKTIFSGVHGPSQTSIGGRIPPPMMGSVTGSSIVTIQPPSVPSRFMRRI
jgi:hypothetical protein